MSIARIITNAPQGVLVDHINRDKTDNTSKNLRFCNAHQNSLNISIGKNNKTGYNGVNYVKRDKKYQARIGWKRKRLSLGVYRSAKEAALAYDKKARELFGEFASLNFPVGWIDVEE